MTYHISHIFQTWLDQNKFKIHFKENMSVILETSLGNLTSDYYFLNTKLST